jgi:hypothetical protein
VPNGVKKTKTKKTPKAEPAVSTPSRAEFAASFAAIMAEITAMEKGGHNDGLGYDFVSIHQILEELRPRIAAHGIAVFPTIDSFEVEHWPRTDRQGNVYGQGTTIYVMLKLEFTDGTNTKTVSALGEASDTSDKAANKAQTAALKQALSKTFLISADEDNDTAQIEPGKQRSFQPRATAQPADNSSTRNSHAQRNHDAKVAASKSAIAILTDVESDREKWGDMIGNAIPALQGKKSSDYTGPQWKQIEVAFSASADGNAQQSAPDSTEWMGEETVDGNGEEQRNPDDGNAGPDDHVQNDSEPISSNA